MRVLVFSRLQLDRPSAHAVHNVHTCAALASAGVRVVLHADLGGRSQNETLRAFGAAPSPHLTIRDMGWRWHAAALPLVAGGLLKKVGGEPSIVLLNEIRPFSLTLARAAKRRGHLLAFEAHNAAGKIALAAAGIALEAMAAVPPHAGGHNHGHDHDHAPPAPVLTIAKTRNPSPPATPQGAGPVQSEEDVEEAAGRERARPKPDPKAIAAAREKEALEREILSYADLLLAPQPLTLEALRGLLREGVPARAVPNGTLQPPASSPRERDIEILYLGSLLTWKGVDALVAAMPRLFPYTLTIVGGRDDADRRLLQQMALQLGVSTRVKFVPAVPPSEVWGIYARAKVGVVPLSGAYLEAREYTFPMKLVEMMAAGVAIVAADLPSVREIVRDGEEALLAASDDPDAYAAAIRRLLDDPALASRLAANARRKAEEFTYARRAERLMEAFTRVAS